jgi:hypothetical protein
LIEFVEKKEKEETMNIDPRRWIVEFGGVNETTNKLLQQLDIEEANKTEAQLRTEPISQARTELDIQSADYDGQLRIVGFGKEFFIYEGDQFLRFRNMDVKEFCKGLKALQKFSEMTFQKSGKLVSSVALAVVNKTNDELLVSSEYQGGKQSIWNSLSTKIKEHLPMYFSSRRGLKIDDCIEGVGQLLEENVIDNDIHNDERSDAELKDDDACFEHYPEVYVRWSMSQMRNKSVSCVDGKTTRFRLWGGMGDLDQVLNCLMNTVKTGQVFIRTEESYSPKDWVFTGGRIYVPHGFELGENNQNVGYYLKLMVVNLCVP